VTDPLSIITRELQSQHIARAYELSPDDALDDIGVDWLDRATITVALEEAFDIELPDAAVEGWQTVGDIVESVRVLAGEGCDG
jgi:acyl carrier protein